MDGKRRGYGVRRYKKIKFEKRGAKKRPFPFIGYDNRPNNAVRVMKRKLQILCLLAYVIHYKNKLNKFEQIEA